MATCRIASLCSARCHTSGCDARYAPSLLLALQARLLDNVDLHVSCALEAVGKKQGNHPKITTDERSRMHVSGAQPGKGGGFFP